jgi:PAS domain S-box-containing protein
MKKYFWFVLLSGVLVFYGFLFIFIYNSARQDAINNLNAQQSLHATQAADGIAAFFDHWIAVLTAYAQMKDIAALNDSGRHLMDVLYETGKQQLYTVTRMDANGRIIYTTPEMPNTIGRDISDQEHIREVLSKRQPVVSDVFKSVQGFDTVAIHVPVFRNKAFLGTVAVTVNFQVLAKRFLDDIRIGKTGHAWMISRKGKELYCSDPSHTGRSVYEVFKKSPSFLALVGHMVKGDRGITTFDSENVQDKSAKNHTSHAVYMPIPVGNTYWSIAVTSSEEEVLASLSNFRNQLLLITVLLLLGTIVLLYYGLKARFIIREAKKRREIENALQIEHRRLDEIIEYLPDATFVIDRNSCVVAWNRAMENLTGIRKIDMMGKSDYEYAVPLYDQRRPTLIDLVIAPDDAFLFRHYNHIERGGNIISAETHVPKVFGWRGAFLWVSACALNDGNGNVIGAIETIRDITERKTAAEAFQNQQNKISSIFLAAPVGIGMVINRVIKEANDTLCQMTGYAREELLEQSARILYPTQEDFEFVGREKYRQIAENNFGTVETHWQKKDGTIIQILLSSVPLDLHDHTKGVTFTALDITVRKQMEDALRASERNYREIFNSTSEAIIIDDVETGKILDVNDTAIKMYGYDSKEEFMACRIADLSANNSPYDETEGKKLVRKCLIEGPQVVEWFAKRKNGETFWVEVSMRRTDIGGRGKFLAVVRDITERKRAEEERGKLLAQLQQAQKLESIGTLAGGIAHDFNNLLMGIEGHTALMLHDLEASHPHRTRLEHIEEHIRSATGLTEQLLGFARGGRYEVKSANMNEIVKKTSTMFGRTKKEITIHNKYRKDLWYVEVDRSQMEQVFMNLFVNAWQAMPGGGHIYLETDNFEVTDESAHSQNLAPGRYIKITVRDTGTGMDAKTLERIFDPFFTTKGMGRGTGLGLATVYGIIKGHEGLITAASELGKGTTFEIHLPATAEPEVKEEAVALDVPLGNETILLVDDEKSVWEIASEMLELLGYQVIGARSGQEALAVYEEKNEEIDLVILDMIMPGISGGETFDRLREINPEQKVLLASGYSVNSEAQEILARGCNGFIQKPFKLVHLSREIRAILDMKIGQCAQTELEPEPRLSCD